MDIAMIAAIGKNLELGKDNRLIWHFKEDMAFFKAATSDAAVIMGRKTFESLPGALAGRQNIVISRNPHFQAPGASVATDAAAALELVEKEKVFIIGGEKIYEMFLPIANRLYLTQIGDECADADTFFPAFDTKLYQKTVLKTINVNEILLEFCLYEKKQ